MTNLDRIDFRDPPGRRAPLDAEHMPLGPYAASIEAANASVGVESLCRWCHKMYPASSNRRMYCAVCKRISNKWRDLRRKEN